MPLTVGAIGLALRAMAEPDYSPNPALLLGAPPATGGNLVFGGDEGDTPISIALNAALPTPTLVARVAPQVQLQMVAILPPPSFHAQATYTSNTARPTVGKATTAWQNAQPTQTDCNLAHQNTTPLPAGFAARHQNASLLLMGFWHRLPAVLQAQWVLRVGVWQEAGATHHNKDFAYQNATRTLLPTLGIWQNASRAPRNTRFTHQEASRQCRRQKAATWQNAMPRQRGQWGRIHSAQTSPHYWLGLWGAGRTPLPGRSSPPPKPPVPPCYTPSTELLFVDAPAIGGYLLFSCGKDPQPPATVVIAIKRFYMTTHSIQIHRADTGAAIHATNFSMSLDAESWTWRWNATITEHSAAQLGDAAGGAPPELVVLVNGHEYRLLLESRQRNRQFIPTTWSISGRGLAALLDTPYATEQTFAAPVAINAQQLAESILTINGVSLGWGIDWQLTDWLVPAGAWSLQGSYIAALSDIAQAVGGYVQPHDSARTLRLLPNYPAAPWNWGILTPDIELPDSVVQVEGSEFISKPSYTRAMVGGTTAGVFGPFTRAGTAGLLLAPQATHPLIGDAAAHRQRGLAILSDTGRQERLTLSLPLLAETGLIKPGVLLRYNASGANTTSSARSVLGMVRGCELRWAPSGASQTITLEVHHDV